MHCSNPCWKGAFIGKDSARPIPTIPEKRHVIHNRVFSQNARKASRPGRLIFVLRKSLILNGGQRRDRTADAGLFRDKLAH
jgi:hypothetical protein